MRFLVLFLIVCSINGVYGQVTAGSVPVGAGIGYPELFVYIDTNVSLPEDTSYLDLDCDGIHDLGVVFRKGKMDNDVPNWIKLAELNTDYTVSMDTSAGTPLFNFGYSIDNTDCVWLDPDDVWLGMFAMWDLYSGVAYNKYFMYKKSSTNEIGWVKITFDIDEWDGTYPIHMYISEALYLCEEAGVDGIEVDKVLLYPNPVNGNKVRIQSSVSIVYYSLYTSIGRLIRSEEYTNAITLPDENGVYLIQWKDDSGRSGINRVVKQ